ncbi:MAG: hypothetical protein F4Y27_10490 [Acidimicrobiaceae bacterium]|nr:hypothetical protein [Acidimicrobiaceae bacterium]MYA75094.1 hypothetical protein [Acidimicrobiaceae bacterium]MYC43303.1 hypothetical protein [Acidimicrobiaceae bacterium]MYG55496.1 hypothetical protein [Acidimicrobiaceae bacterium]MYJ99283.1 hypothetical protein [Acidimicrobiaceae bacterium]
MVGNVQWERAFVSDELSLRQILERTARKINEGDSDITATYQFVVERPDGRDVHRLVIVDGECELLPDEGEATSTVVVSQEDAPLIFSGRFDSMKAFMEGRMRIEGDLMAMSVLSSFMSLSESSAAVASQPQSLGFLSPLDSPSLAGWEARLADRLTMPQSLREVAQVRDFYIGAAISAPTGPHAELVSREFNGIGAENAFKWNRLAKFVGDYDFTLTDAFAEYAERHDMRLRGHALVWGRGGRPHNLESTLRASSDQRKTLLRLMREHISTVAARYRGKVAVWDVVNEPMAYSGTGLDKNVFFETLGEEYVVESFRLARAADPEAELVLNEQISWNEYDGRSASEFVDFVRRLLDVETPIDGIGLQGHMLMGTPDPVALDRFLRRIEDLGLFIEITEMDMRIGLFADEQDPLGAQADSYNMLAEVFAAVPAVRGVMFWGAADSHTWLDSFPPFDAASPNQPLLFDRDLKPKPAYYAFMAGLASRQPIGATP